MRFYTAWVKTGPTATPPGTSALRGEPDVIGPKTDIDTGMSGLGGKAEALAYPWECPGVAEGVEKVL